jgi:hypothetical protein
VVGHVAAPRVAIKVLVRERCGARAGSSTRCTEPHAVRRLLATVGLADEPPLGRSVLAA